MSRPAYSDPVQTAQRDREIQSRRAAATGKSRAHVLGPANVIGACARKSLEKEDHDVTVRNFQCDPQVEDLTGQGRRPPAGSESCVDRS